MTYMYVKNLGKAETLQRCVKKKIFITICDFCFHHCLNLIGKVEKLTLESQNASHL